MLLIFYCMIIWTYCPLMVFLLLIWRRILLRKKKNDENQQVISNDLLEVSIRPITNYKTNNIKDEFNGLS